MIDRSAKTVNLHDVKPERAHAWERDAKTGYAILLIPKFKGKILGRWLQPRLKHPLVKLNLDEYGSAVWECCDGNTSVKQIAEILKSRFGDKIEPVMDRLSLFIRHLDEANLVRITNLEALKNKRTHPEITSA